jgi:hypothetical protein
MIALVMKSQLLIQKTIHTHTQAYGDKNTSRRRRREHDAFKSRENVHTVATNSSLIRYEYIVRV